MDGVDFGVEELQKSIALISGDVEGEGCRRLQNVAYCQEEGLSAAFSSADEVGIVSGFSSREGALVVV